MDESPFAKAHKKLLEHLKCDKHSNEKYCWKPMEPPFHGKICITLNSHELEEWAASIKSMAFTVFHPPESDHWWKLKVQYTPGGRRCPKRPQTPEPRREQILRLEFATAGSDSVVNTIAHPAALHFRHRQSNSHADAATCSPIKGFHPRDYNGAGLKSFLTWMTNYYEDGDYLDIFPLLEVQKVRHRLI
jgi:hypothetical protein